MMTDALSLDHKLCNSAMWLFLTDFRARAGAPRDGVEELVLGDPRSSRGDLAADSGSTRGFAS
jgi:hypothetical protein